MRGFRKKIEKPLFFGILGQNEPYLGKMFQFSVKKWKRNLLTHFCFIFQPGKSENSNVRFLRKFRGRKWQDDRDEGDFIGPNPPGRRRTKNDNNLCPSIWLDILLILCFDIVWANL